MQNIFDRDHAEVVPPLREGQETWYLPIFGVYHPQKPGQIRVVFDSSAQTQGRPDLNNSPLRCLTAFQKGADSCKLRTSNRCFTASL